MTSPTIRRALLVYLDGVRGLWLAYAIFIVVMAMIFSGIGLIVHVTGGFDGSTWTSIWEQAMYGTRYFPLSMGVVVLVGFLPVATTHGIGRTSFVLGTSVLVITMGVAVALFLAAGHWIEYRLFAAGGAVAEYSSPHLFSSGRDVGWVFVESVVIVTANIAGGYFIASMYYRWRWLRATLALPVLILPIVAVEALMSSGWPGNVVIGTLDIDRGPLAAVIPASVAVIVGTFVLTLAVLRRTDVRTTSG